MKRLFAIRTGNGKIVQDDNREAVYFGNKKDAKTYRDELNMGLKVPLFFITRGPDHGIFN